MGGVDVTCASWDLEGQWAGSQQGPHEKIAGPHQWLRQGVKEDVGGGTSLAKQLLPVCSGQVSEDHAKYLSLCFI